MEYNQQAHDVEMTFNDVDTTSSRRIDVSTTSFQGCVPAGHEVQQSEYNDKTIENKFTKYERDKLVYINIRNNEN